ncbi:RNA-guided endonuclease IscB [Rivularia sp. UHCC 0363]|uniref:RNA-guided endonuclease IscB n=1 Tax=Rivularia sp. UHCC 0363 TaxID=3110244 RepID=UPI002B1F4348|nr:RNA-guided endonuclease IscB [Rivularia sp. UHCC 0363]MEA5592867.1 RNA-guided endonuclease IscB [Rivularia sp. UHCC 0363]
MSNFVFVIDTDKKPCNPIHPATARKLLTSKKAAVYRTYPFTIILKNVSTKKLSSVQIKIDPGSRVTGFALVKDNKVVFGAELTHRGSAIKASLESRKSLRRGRRARHTKYRKPKFSNRARPKGWLAPSLRHRVETVLTWVKKFIKLTPVTGISQELVRFDLQQLENPEISGVEYQQGELLGYEVREYLLNKWDRKCTYCGVENVPLQVEHIHPKAKGGSNKISNLCLACDKCNKKKGTQDIKTFLSKKPELSKKIQLQAKRPLKDAAAVNSTRWALFNALKTTNLPVSTGSGGLTKFNRTRLKLPKTHWLDAGCVGTVDSLEVLTTKPLLIKTVGHGSRQSCRTDKYGFPNRYVPSNKIHFGFQTGDIVKAVVKTGKKVGCYVGKVAIRSSGSFNISGLHGLVQGISYKFCKRIHSKDGYSYAT